MGGTTACSNSSSGTVNSQELAVAVALAVSAGAIEARPGKTGDSCMLHKIHIVTAPAAAAAIVIGNYHKVVFWYRYPTTMCLSDSLFFLVIHPFPQLNLEPCTVCMSPWAIVYGMSSKTPHATLSWLTQSPPPFPFSLPRILSTLPSLAPALMLLC